MCSPHALSYPPFLNPQKTALPLLGRWGHGTGSMNGGDEHHFQAEPIHGPSRAPQMKRHRVEGGAWITESPHGGQMPQPVVGFIEAKKKKKR